MAPGDGLVEEHAYLVARGVRPLALVGNCVARARAMRRARLSLERSACDGVHVFVLDRGDGFADYGYAAAPWVVHLYGWAVSAREADDSVLARQRHRIVGLLLGYSVSAISDFETAATATTSSSPAPTPT